MSSSTNEALSWKRNFFILTLILIILRLPALLNPVLDVDEAIYGLFARIWFDGGVPYIDCAETKPLGIYFFYGVIFSIFGKFNTTAVHAITIAVVGVTSYVVYAIARKLYGHKAGLWAAFFYIVFGVTYIPKYIATTIEPIMLLPVALQFYFWLRFENEGRRMFALASGVAFSTACLFKYQAGMNLFILLAYLGILKPVINRGIPYKNHWKGFAHFLFGAIWLPVIMIGYLAYVGGLSGFWYWNIQGNAEYIGGGTAAFDLTRRLLTRVLPYIASTGLLWVLAFIRVVKHNKSRPQEWLIVLWLFLSFIPVSAGLRFYGHYFLLLVPPLAILASEVADEIWSNRRRRFVRRLIAFWIILPALGFTTARFFIPQIHTAVGEDNLDNYMPIAEYVAKHTSPDERIIAWGYAPLIYWYSERMPATRFFWSDVLVGRVAGLGDVKPADADKFVNPEAWDMFMADVARHRPTYIIDTAPAGLHNYKNYPISLYPRIADYLDINYHKETTVGGAVLYRRNN